MSDFDDIRIDKNSLVITIAFQPRGTDIEMPPWAADLEQLGSADMGSEPTDSVPDGESAVATTTTVAGEPSANDAPTTTGGVTTTTAVTTTTSG